MVEKQIEAAREAVREAIKPEQVMRKTMRDYLERARPGQAAMERNAVTLAEKTREYVRKDVLATGAHATRILTAAIFIAKEGEFRQSASEIRNMAKEGTPGAAVSGYLITLAQGFEKVASQYKEMAALSAAGRTREALSMQKDALRSEFVLNSARANYLFVADIGSRFGNAQALDVSLGFSSVTQDLVKALVPLQKQASEIAVRTDATVKAVISGKSSGAENSRAMLSLAESVQKAQGDYSKISEGVAVCTHLLVEYSKLSQMAGALKGKDSDAAKALQSTAGQMKSFAHSAILSPKEFAGAYRNNGMFGGEFSLKDRVDDAITRAYNTIGSLAYGKAAAGSHPLWNLLAEVEIAKFSLALSPIAPKPEVAERSSRVARYAWKDMLQFEGQAFRVAIEGKVLSSDLQLRALDALGKSVAASSSRYAAAIKGDFASAEKFAQASFSAELEFITGFSKMKLMNMHLDTAGRLFHKAALFALPAIGVTDAFYLIAKNHRQMSAGEAALEAGGAILPFVSRPLLRRIMQTRFVQARVLPKARSALEMAEKVFRGKLETAAAAAKAGKKAYKKASKFGEELKEKKSSQISKP